MPNGNSYTFTFSFFIGELCLLLVGAATFSRRSSKAKSTSLRSFSASWSAGSGSISTKFSLLRLLSISKFSSTSTGSSFLTIDFFYVFWPVLRFEGVEKPRLPFSSSASGTSYLCTLFWLLIGPNDMLFSKLAKSGLLPL